MKHCLLRAKKLFIVANLHIQSLAKFVWGNASSFNVPHTKLQIGWIPFEMTASRLQKFGKPHGHHSRSLYGKEQHENSAQHKFGLSKG